MLEDASPKGWRSWRSGMRELAARPNVMVKLSGPRHVLDQCTVAPVAADRGDTVATFGAERCIFGSNFPIESLWTTYERIIAVMRACLAERSQSEQRRHLPRQCAAHLSALAAAAWRQSRTHRNPHARHLLATDQAPDGCARCCARFLCRRSNTPRARSASSSRSVAGGRPTSWRG
jgi:hypothetical protein